MGIHDDIPQARSVYHHVELACHLPFFLSQEIPLPPALRVAQLFLAQSDEQAASAFWRKQLTDTETAVRDSTPTENVWAAQIPPNTRPATGQLRATALAHLMRCYNIGGAQWAKQFIFGFPLVGTIGQKDTSPTDKKALQRPILGHNQLFADAHERFNLRASKSGSKNATSLWAEAQQQCDKGWLTNPFRLCADQDRYNLQFSSLNIAFRFGVAKTGKLRACGDLRHSHTNLACAVLTPIKLISWDHIDELARMTVGSAKQWHFMKADHEAAYKQLPVQ